VIKDEKTRNELARIAPYGSFLAEAPAAIAVVIDPSRPTTPLKMVPPLRRTCSSRPTPWVWEAAG